MLATIALSTLVLTSQQASGIGDLDRVVKPTTVETVDGKKVQVPDKSAKATVLVFMLTDCPVSNRYAPEVRRIEEAYREKGVTFYRVYVYEAAAKEDIIAHTKDFAYKSLAIKDGKHAMVRALGATVSPEAAVLTPDGKVQYRGRIDDAYVDHGRLRESGYRQDLRVALDEVLAGKAVTLPRTIALGCFIETIERPKG
jgi:thiol-disulfide isomerase/thioredoxin